MARNTPPLPTNNYPSRGAMLTLEAGFDAISKSWQGRGFYEEGSIVVFDGGLYICNADIQAPEYADADNPTPRVDTVNWSPVGADGSILSYNPETAYNPGELVRDSEGNVWLARTNTQNDPLEDGGNWYQLSTERWRSDSDGGIYNEGDVVTIGTQTFINVGGSNTNLAPEDDEVNWQNVTPSIIKWANNIDFTTNQIVEHEGNLWLALSDNGPASSNSIVPDIDDDASLQVWRRLTAGSIGDLIDVTIGEGAGYTNVWSRNTGIRLFDANSNIDLTDGTDVTDLSSVMTTVVDFTTPSSLTTDNEMILDFGGPATGINVWQVNNEIKLDVTTTATGDVVQAQTIATVQPNTRYQFVINRTGLSNWSVYFNEVNDDYSALGNPAFTFTLAGTWVGGDRQGFFSASSSTQVDNAVSYTGTGHFVHYWAVEDIDSLVNFRQSTRRLAHNHIITYDSDRGEWVNSPNIEIEQLQIDELFFNENYITTVSTNVQNIENNVASDSDIDLVLDPLNNGRVNVGKPLADRDPNDPTDTGGTTFIVNGDSDTYISITNNQFTSNDGDVFIGSTKDSDNDVAGTVTINNNFNVAGDTINFGDSESHTSVTVHGDVKIDQITVDSDSISGDTNVFITTGDSEGTVNIDRRTNIQNIQLQGNVVSSYDKDSENTNLILTTEDSSAEVHVGSGLDSDNSRDLRVWGDLHVHGELNTVRTTETELHITDASITLRDGSDENSRGDAFINVDRGGDSDADRAIKWNEADQRWELNGSPDLDADSQTEFREISTVQRIDDLRDVRAKGPETAADTAILDMSGWTLAASNTATGDAIGTLAHAFNGEIAPATNVESWGLGYAPSPANPGWISAVNPTGGKYFPTQLRLLSYALNDRPTNFDLQGWTGTEWENILVNQTMDDLDVTFDITTTTSYSGFRIFCRETPGGWFTLVEFRVIGWYDTNFDTVSQDKIISYNEATRMWEPRVNTLGSYYTDYSTGARRPDASRVDFITETVQTTESSVQAIRLIVNGEEVILPIGGSGGSALVFTDNHNVDVDRSTVPQYSIQRDNGWFDVTTNFQAGFLVQEQSSLGELIGTPQPDTISDIDIRRLTATITATPATAGQYPEVDITELMLTDISPNQQTIFDEDDGVLGTAFTGTINPDDSENLSTNIIVSTGTVPFTPTGVTVYARRGYPALAARNIVEANVELLVDSEWTDIGTVTFPETTAAGDRQTAAITTDLVGTALRITPTQNRANTPGYDGDQWTGDNAFVLSGLDVSATITENNFVVEADIDSDTDMGTARFRISDQFRGTYTIEWDYEIDRSSTNPNDVNSPETVTGQDSVNVNIVSDGAAYAAITQVFDPPSAEIFGTDGETDDVSTNYTASVVNGVISVFPGTSQISAAQTSGGLITVDNYLETNNQRWSLTVNKINTYVSNNVSLNWGQVELTTVGNYTGTPDIRLNNQSHTFTVNDKNVDFSIAGMPTGIIDPYRVTGQTFDLTLSDLNLDHRDGTQTDDDYLPAGNSETAEPIVYDINTRVITNTAYNLVNRQTSYTADYSEIEAPSAPSTPSINNWRFSYTDARNNMKDTTATGRFEVALYGYLLHIGTQQRSNDDWQVVVNNSHENSTPIYGPSWGNISWNGTGAQLKGLTTYLLVPAGLTVPSTVFVKLGDNAGETSQNPIQIGSNWSKVASVEFNDGTSAPFEHEFELYQLWSYPSNTPDSTNISGRIVS